MIASTQAAVEQGQNRFSTEGTLTTSDLHNEARYDGQAVGVNLNTGQQGGKYVVNGVGAGVGQDSGSAQGTTTAGISGIAGDQSVRTGDTTGTERIFDQNQVQREIDAQVAITAEFGKQASKAVGDYAQAQMQVAEQLRAQGKEAEADAIKALWGDNGSLRLAAHTVIGGLTGGVGGAAGAATGTLTAPAVAHALSEAGISGPLADVLTAAASTAVGAAAGGVNGAAAAGNEVANNYLSHNQKAQRNKELSECKTVACKVQTQAKWTAIDVGQEASFTAGMMAGVPVSLYEAVEGIVKTVSNPVETYDALKSLFYSDNVLANVSEAVKQSYIDRLDRMEAEYQKAGASGSFNSGVEGGKIVTEIAGLLAGGAGLVRGGTVLTEKVVAKVASQAEEALKIEGAANRWVKNADEYVNILSPADRQHILFGDGPGSGGHMYPGQPGKSIYPRSWTEEKILHNVGDVVTSPTTQWYAQTGTGGITTKAGDPARWVAWETRDGVSMRVVFEPSTGRTVTAFPDAAPNTINLKPITR